MMRAVSGEAARIAIRSTPVSPRAIASSTASCIHSPSSWVVCSGFPVAISASSARMSFALRLRVRRLRLCGAKRRQRAGGSQAHDRPDRGGVHQLLLSKGRTSAQTRKRSVFPDADSAAAPRFSRDQRKTSEPICPGL